MKLDLSSQISLERVPQKYYRPENAFEDSALTRYEKIKTRIFESVDKGSAKVAREIVEAMQKKQKQNKPFVLGLPGGVSPQSVYTELIRMHKEDNVSFSNMIVFNTYEYYPLSDEAQSNLHSLKEVFLNKIDIKPENIYSPDVKVEKTGILDSCERFGSDLEKVGGLNYLLLGLGSKGNIGFNMPGSNTYSQTRLVVLDGDSINEAAAIFGATDKVPLSAITMGLSDMLAADKITLIAWGEQKAESVQVMVEGPVTDTIPASALQTHSNVKVIVDLSAAENLTRISYPWLVTSCEWSNQLLRRAIVWLCSVVDKPILKLTDKDYNENGLNELLALYGSAYNVNIKIFNDLQHTITGWPGGKPDADDSNRPERATPFPKKIIIFSPHPDDDVISMGGTFQRLVNQGHEVHVAYQTSGNIAVSDEEVIRYISFVNSISEKYDPKNTELKDKYDKILHYLLHEKTKDDLDTADILFIKGRIRREEARTATRYVGIPSENVHFLDLPFYDTGKVKKDPISEVDVNIVKDFILTVKPHQMFVAGDLADPHGTHKVCLNAIFAAVDVMKEDEWMEDCRIWMYRGAWMEWEIDHIEMAVPLSPEELRSKRNAILKHQSQMENAPFLGNDERLFWQRSEDRNRATAHLYWKLGLASYEAIEAFVEYVPL